jgi:phage/plasmid-associated DNA primase
MTAPVFQGQQGWGKTVLGLILAALIGEENTACISQADLDGNFNGHFVTKLLVIADEVVNQETIRDSESILKKYITDPRIMANVKNTPQYEVMNRMSWWFTSNKAIPVKVEGRGDRRYSVFAAPKPVPEPHKAMLRSMFGVDGRFTADAEREVAAFGSVLESHTVDRAAVMTPFRNAAREALIKAGQNSAELFLAEVEERGVEAVMAEYDLGLKVRTEATWDRGDGVVVSAFYAAYQAFCTATGTKPCSQEKLGQHVRQAFPNSDRRRAPATEDGKRPWVYQGVPRLGHSS